MPSSAAESRSHGGVLQLTDICRSFGPVVALKEISLDIRAGEFFALLGPSGCGKTTLLRIIAGLDEPDSGSALLDGTDLLRVPAHHRPVNTVFQSYALFPHLNVAENIGFGLRMKKIAVAEMTRRVDDIMEIVEVTKLAARKPSELSGGQRQRVALARALVNEPRVLLLDEPLAAVDQKLRKQLQGDLHALQRRLGITFIYVTHDQEEALSLSDRLGVMNHGELEHVGAPREVYDRPRTRFVAEFLGNCNLIPAEISSDAAKTSFGTIRLSQAANTGKHTLFFRPERVLVGAGPFAGIVQEATFMGAQTHLLLKAGGDIIRAALLNQSRMNFRPGEVIAWDAPAEAITIF